MDDNFLSDASVIVRGSFSDTNVDMVFSSKMKAKIFMSYLSKVTKKYCTSPTSAMKFRSMKIEDVPIDPYITNRHDLNPLFYMKVRKKGLDIIEMKKCEKIEEYIGHLESNVILDKDGYYYVCHIYSDNEVNAVDKARELIQKKQG